MDDYRGRAQRVLKNRVRRRGIYLLPNLFTTAALFAGFYAIVQAMNAASTVGRRDLRRHGARRPRRPRRAHDRDAERVRRGVRQPRRHGGFGAAPALVIYEWVLRDLGKLGWIAAFVYCAGAALRLARFNTLLEVADKRWFQGLPSPSAAARRRGLRVDRRGSGLRSPAGFRVLRVVRHRVRRADDGQQPQVLQLQDDQPEEERAVRRDLPDRAVRRAAFVPAAARAVRGLRRVRRVGLRRVGLADVARAPHARRRRAVDTAAAHRGAGAVPQRSGDGRAGHRAFRAALPQCTVHVYDNGSNDGTAGVARGAGAIVRTRAATRQGRRR